MRAFLLLVFAALSCTKPQPASQPPAGSSPRKFPSIATTYQTVPVAEGVYSFIAPESRTLYSGNSTAIFGEKGVLVVDSGNFPDLTLQMIAEIKTHTQAPVQYLVNTHWHHDHIGGNSTYSEAFPGLRIISTPNTREKMEHFPDAADPKHVDELIPHLEAAVTTGKDREGTKLSPEALQFYKELLFDCQEFSRQTHAARPPTLPDTTFEERLEIDLGGRKVQVLFLGRGNTGGDAVVYVPDVKVLITGDLVISPFPFATGSFIREWLETLRSLDAIEAQAIVPGHGPVAYDKRYLSLEIKALESILAQVNEAVAAGLSLEETQKRVALEEIKKQMTAGDPDREAGFEGYFLSLAVKRAYREAKEGPLKDEDF